MSSPASFDASSPVTVGVVIPNISQKMVKIGDVENILDVMKKVSKMTSMHTSSMLARRGGKIAETWHAVLEGDVIYIDYPKDLIPKILIERASTDPANKRAPITPRPKAVIPIKSPVDKLVYQTGPEKFNDNTLIDISDSPTSNDNPTVNTNDTKMIYSTASLNSGGGSDPDTDGAYFGIELLGRVSSQVQLPPGVLIPLKSRKNATNSADSIRVIIKFWSGHELSLTTSLETKIGDMISIITKRLAIGGTHTESEDLELLGPFKNKLDLTDKLKDIATDPCSGEFIISVNMKAGAESNSDQETIDYFSD
ncbi:hypothetical protein H072_233 [Dactylellina haptotyla CBS 200.50]|uniref:Uncharacterized protein n=1 Tax=Dactylellina haptotyla (strain CBS 200.50) TaxID=1284197 RepID=S8CDI6_DACHA|nr:hypothetical protein H072_233 [Dactylellina haptotyla CBS 200.50]